MNARSFVFCGNYQSNVKRMPRDWCSQLPPRSRPGNPTSLWRLWEVVLNYESLPQCLQVARPIRIVSICAGKSTIDSRPQYGQVKGRSWKSTSSVGHDPVPDAGQRWSISAMICSAHMTASAIAQMVAGTLGPAGYCASFRAARMAAAISSTRFRPSSTEAV